MVQNICLLLKNRIKELLFAFLRGQSKNVNIATVATVAIIFIPSLVGCFSRHCEAVFTVNEKPLQTAVTILV